jgi:hypothetical protein
MEIDFGAVSPDAHEDEAKSPKASETAEEYSLIVKIGLVFSVCSCLSTLFLQV